jgi:hypothetical protein
MRLGVMKTQVPANVKLIQSSAEEGLAEELGGAVNRLPTKRVSGYEVWTMTGTGELGEVTQAMLRRGPVLYKLMAISIGPGKDQESIDRFIDSLKLRETDAESPDAPARDIGGGFDLHNLSKKIGGASLLILIVLLVYLAMRRRK